MTTAKGPHHIRYHYTQTAWVEFIFRLQKKDNTTVKTVA